MTAQPGDIVLYNGSNICIFYAGNSWSYTRLGKIDGLSESELRTFLKAGQSNIAVSIRSLSTNPSFKGEGNIYSLNGVRVNNPSKGIYIQNGKKVIL